MSHSDDAQLMAQVGTGDIEAFGELYGRLRDRAFRVALAVCHDEHRAWEAVQDGFVSVWHRRESYEPRRGTVAAWVLTCVRHQAIDISRRDGRHLAHLADGEHLEQRPARDDTSQTVIERDNARRLRDLLAALPEAQREVIALAYFGQLSQREIASRLDVPPGTVKGRMRMGLKRLRGDAEQVA